MIFLIYEIPSAFHRQTEFTSESTMFWDVTCLLKIYGYLRGICCLHLQGRRKGGSSMFHCSMDKRLSDYTLSHPRGQSSLYPPPSEPQISLSPISAVNWNLDDSSESSLWVVLLCEVIQVNNPKTAVIIRQQMCSIYLRMLYTEMVLDSELQKSDTVIQFMSLKYQNYYNKQLGLDYMCTNSFNSVLTIV
jgi:hypothetical protein